MSKFDSWLTTEPSWRISAFHFSYEKVFDQVMHYCNDSADIYNVYLFPWNNLDELNCDSCECLVGYHTYDTSDSTNISYSDFWQMPDESLLCVFCYEKVINQID